MAKRAPRETHGISLGIQSNPDLGVLAKELASVDKKLRQELVKVNRKSSNLIVADARKRAKELGGVHAKAAGAIKPGTRATAVAIIADATGSRHPYAMVAFLGAKRRTGWNAHERHDAKSGAFDADSLSRRRRGLKVDTAGGTFRRGKNRPQHPPWIGNQWEPGAGSYGKEPYAINPAIRAKLDEVIDFHGEAIDDLLDTIWRDSQVTLSSG